MARKKNKAPNLDENLNDVISINEGFGDAHDGGEHKNHEEITQNEPSLGEEPASEEVSTEEPVEETPSEENTDEVSVKEDGFKGKIKPEYDVIQGLIDSINQYYKEEIGDLKKYKEFETVRINWEKQARGACEMIVSKANSDHFDTNDPYKCSPLAFAKIANSKSRDLSVLDLCGAVITFYNSISSQPKEFGEAAKHYPFEDYTNKIVKIKEGMFEFAKPCSNNSLLMEGSFNRLYSILKKDTYAILSAYRVNFSKEENIARNRKLRGILNNYKMGVYQLVGHWQEAPDGKEYLETPKNELKDTIERSYVVKKPKEMSIEEFRKIIQDCLTIDGVTQDCGILHLKNNSWVGYTSKGETFPIGEKLTLNKVAQAYSQWVKKLDVPFVFEFVECPSSNSGKMMYTKNNIKYLT